MYESIKKQNPKSISDSLVWINSAVLFFKVSSIDVKVLIEFLKFCLSNNNQSVRQNGIVILGTLRVLIGPEIRLLLVDLNPSLVSLIDAEFKKVQVDDKVEEVEVQDDVLDDLFPRVDLSVLITSQIIDDLNNSNWKIRKEALDQLISILNVNTRIKGNLGSIYY